ncbi:hypothetical protein E1B28_000296 [Marasmius oreades]|uniref:C2H2-type domain-containing protein n=1 Tax=Marasmius oreades TaxID=181124 RepID=A0A9P7V0Y9_9AGAR|nr:uncharacterized protein E1B28_000296 [Marasmius oreades]KAG7098335.1 hypothetical protein E1B28_000296 [Marasmius oreades]
MTSNLKRKCKFECTVCWKYRGSTTQALRLHQSHTGCGEELRIRTEANPQRRKPVCGFGNIFQSASPKHNQTQDSPPPDFSGTHDFPTHDFPTPKRRRVEMEEVEDEGDPAICDPRRFISVDFTGAGAVLEGDFDTRTFFDKLKDEKIEKGETMWLPFQSRDEWELARWLMMSGVTHNDLDELLKLSIVQNGIEPSFRNKRQFFKIIDELPKVRGGWRCQELAVTGNILERDEIGSEKPKTEVLELWMRDPVECIRELMQDPRFTNSMRYAPEKVYTDASMSTRTYSEMWTADWWWATQKLLPQGATIVPVILASDKTQLSTFSGDKSAWPVYLTIGNISASVRKKPSEGASVLIGYIPVSKLECFTSDVRSLQGYRLFHESMRILLASLVEAGDPIKGGLEMLCADGNVRKVYPLLAAYIADFPEQCLVVGCQERRCPKCLAKGDQLGDPLHSVLRDPEKTLEALKESARGNRESAHRYGLRDITPFWRDLPLCNIFHCFTPDILHQLHKGVFKDHMTKWSTESVFQPNQSARNAEVDIRFQSMPRHSDLRHFKKGISLITQWTGNEYKQMEKILLGVIAGAVPRDVVVCMRGVLDFIHYAQLDFHTDHSLEKMKDALCTFHDHKEAAFLHSGIREHFNIPKIHATKHYVPMIKSHGVAGGFNTEWSERLHIDFAKNAYRASNRREFIKQMARWLDRRESIQSFARFLSWSLDEPVKEITPRKHGEEGNNEGAERGDAECDSDDEQLPSINKHPLESTCFFAKRPPLLVDLSTLENDYGCDRFVYCLEKFLVDRRMRRDDYWDTRPGRYEVYKRFQISVPPIPEVPSKTFTDTVHATPSSKHNHQHVPARFDTVLAQEKLDEDSHAVGLKGDLICGYCLCSKLISKSEVCGLDRFAPSSLFQIASASSPFP